MTLYRRHYVTNISCWSYMLYTTHVVQFHFGRAQTWGKLPPVLCLFSLTGLFLSRRQIRLHATPILGKVARETREILRLLSYQGTWHSPFHRHVLCLAGGPDESISDVSTHTLWLRLFVSWRLPELKIIIRRIEGYWCQKDDLLVS